MQRSSAQQQSRYVPSNKRQRLSVKLHDGGDIAAAREAARQMGDQAKQINDQREEREQALRLQLLELPNPCLDEVPVGAGENDNVVLKTKEPPLNCEAKPHWKLPRAPMD